MHTWHIHPNPTDSTLQWSVVGPDRDAAWPYFFSGIRLEAYPNVITAAASETGYDSNGTGVSFPADVAAAAPQETPLAADSVEIYVPGFEDSVLPRATFYAVLLAFGERLAAQPDRPGAWYAAMGAALDKLRAKMAADAAG